MDLGACKSLYHRDLESNWKVLGNKPRACKSLYQGFGKQLEGARGQTKSASPGWLAFTMGQPTVFLAVRPGVGGVGPPMCSGTSIGVPDCPPGRGPHVSGYLPRRLPGSLESLKSPAQSVH